MSPPDSGLAPQRCGVVGLGLRHGRNPYGVTGYPRNRNPIAGKWLMPSTDPIRSHGQNLQYVQPAPKCTQGNADAPNCLGYSSHSRHFSALQSLCHWKRHLLEQVAPIDRLTVREGIGVRANDEDSRALSGWQTFASPSKYLRSETWFMAGVRLSRRPRTLASSEMRNPRRLQAPSTLTAFWKMTHRIPPTRMTR